MKPSALWLFFAFAGVASAAAAEQLPNATDLRASYCARLLSKQIASHRELMGLLGNMPDTPPMRRIKAENAGREDRHARIMAYLEPRVAHLEIEALVSASRMADLDIATNARLQQEAGCLGKDLETATACGAAALRNSPATQKQKQCDTTDWLPF